MGNNSTSKNNSTTPNEFKTKAGIMVDTDGHTHEFMEILENKIKDWVWEGEGSPSVDMDDDELEYINNNMVNSEDNPDVPTGSLTRVEESHHILPLIMDGSLKVGDTLPSNAMYRSYSRNPEATVNYAKSKGWHDDTLVVYRTKGNVPHFKVTDFVSSFADEKESLVIQGKLKIDKITNFKTKTTINPISEEKESTHEELFKELGINDFLKTNPVNTFGERDVVLIDVSYEE